MRLTENVTNWKSIGPGSVGVVREIGYEGDELDKAKNKLAKAKNKSANFTEKLATMENKSVMNPIVTVKYRNHFDMG